MYDELINDSLGQKAPKYYTDDAYFEPGSELMDAQYACVPETQFSLNRQNSGPGALVRILACSVLETSS